MKMESMVPLLIRNKAIQFYQEVTSEEAMNGLGSIYYEKEDYKKAIEFFKKSAEKGNQIGLNNLGTCYELGRGVSWNIDKAIDCYKESAKKGNSQAMSNLGYLYYTKGKFSSSISQLKEAAHWFRQSINKDYSIKDSHYYLGLMHQNGEGVDQCYKSAYKYYKAAADLGSDSAWEKLGDLCYSGYGWIRPDKTRAFDWYSVGAQSNNSQWINNMGLMIENGFDGVIADLLQAEHFYSKAHEMNNSDATFNLGYLYLNHPEFEFDEQNAINIIHEAAVNGNTKAQNFLVNIGVVTNKAEFIKISKIELVDENQIEDSDNKNIEEDSFEGEGDPSDEDKPHSNTNQNNKSGPLQRKGLERYTDLPTKNNKENVNNISKGKDEPINEDSDIEDDTKSNNK